MNNALVAAGVLALLLAIAIQVVARRSVSPDQSELITPLSNVIEGTRQPASNRSERQGLAGPPPAPSSTHDHHGNDHSHCQDHCETSGHQPALTTGTSAFAAIASPSLVVDKHASFVQASGRSNSLSLIRQTAGLPIAFQAVPRQGHAEILSRTTLGGVERQVHREARWRQEGDNAIAFTVGDEGFTLTVQQGRWIGLSTDVSPDVASTLKDLARVIHALSHAFCRSGLIDRAQPLALAGDVFRPWIFENGTLLLVGPDEDGTFSDLYPSRPASWNDLRLQLAADGLPVSAERLVTSPATPADPGFLVRRVIVRYDRPISSP